MSAAEPKFPWETPPQLWRGLKPSAAWNGSVVNLFIAPKSAGPMIPVAQVRALADRGLEGDRFFRESWAAAKRPDKAVSLIEAEVLEMAASEYQVTIAGDQTRRNIITRGVPLIKLLDREFMIGTVLMRGIRLFEPCAHLEKVSQISGIFRALENRSGLKAAILSDGVIQIGDSVTLYDSRRAVLGAG